MHGTRELAILRSGNREMSLKERDPGSRVTKMYEENQTTTIFVLVEKRYKCTAN